MCTRTKPLASTSGSSVAPPSPARPLRRRKSRLRCFTLTVLQKQRQMGSLRLLGLSFRRPRRRPRRFGTLPYQRVARPRYLSQPWSSPHRLDRGAPAPMGLLGIRRFTPSRSTPATHRTSATRSPSRLARARNAGRRHHHSAQQIPLHQWRRHCCRGWPCHQRAYVSIEDPKDKESVPMPTLATMAASSSIACPKALILFAFTIRALISNPAKSL